jgi:hypothetical protein
MAAHIGASFGQASDHERRRIPTAVIRLGLGSLAAVGIVLIALTAYRAISGDAGERPGLVFTIPEGSYQRIAIPGFDSAIELPTEITFASPEEAAITVVNEDVVQHRAGPFLVGPGQTYIQRFPEPGEYVINCSVDASESIAVTVEG